MKINIKDPKHLYALGISVAGSCFAIIIRPFTKLKKHNSHTIVFYGHTLNGNLKAFFDYLNTKSGYKVYFLTLDKEYYIRLQRNSIRPNSILSAFKIKDMVTVAKADAIITSHGLHLFSILRITNIKFIDVWHAVSYKGFHEKDFKLHRTFDESWVSSDYMNNMYVNRFKFKPQNVKTTGYARTDLLITESLSKNQIIKKYNIPKYKKYILIAPTWHQDVPGRDILPFGLKPNKFFSELNDMAKGSSSYIIFRTHFNSGDSMNVENLSNIGFMPYSRYEIAEDFLFIADILVTDWSSIGIDYLPLKRPTIFLDGPAPFKNGFNLGPEFRYGDVVDNFKDLKNLLIKYLKNSNSFNNKHSQDMSKTIKVAYGDTLDGRSRERYLKRLDEVLHK